MNILITGGAGFLGSHLCERALADDHTVVCVDNFSTSSRENIAHLLSNSNFTFVEHDVVMELPTNIKADAVFHLASPASPNHHSPISYHALAMQTIMVNTTATRLLLEFCERNNAKFLFASTSEVYGDPLIHPQVESYNGNVSTTGPRSVYDEAKRFGETITAFFWRDRGVDARIARIFNSYGPRMAPQDMRMIARFLTQALKGEDITVFGDGSQTRSLCYVTDTVEGLYQLMMKPQTSKAIVNIGSDEEYTVMEFARMAQKITRSMSNIVCSEDLPQDDPLKRRADTTLAKGLLGWEPRISLETGLQHMLNDIKKRQVV